MRLGFPLMLLLPSLCPAWGAIVSTENARLPMSLSMVISDLEAEGCNEVSTACLITSKSVTRKQRTALLKSLVGSPSEEDVLDLASSKAIALSSGLALAQPDSMQEVASTASACGGKILYYADPVDLIRNEGLFDTLAPAIEKILARGSKASLFVIVDGDVEETKARLEKAAEGVISNLVAENKSLLLLQDVFETIQYVSSNEAANVVTSQLDKSAPADATSLVAETVSADSLLWPISSAGGDLSHENLAAARVIGPVARAKLANALIQVLTVCQSPDGSVQLVPNFGDLCDAAMQQAVDQLSDDGASSILQSGLGKQIRDNLLVELDSELGKMFDAQVELLQLASFDEFKKGLSKLLISPNLASDMEKLANKSIASFSKAVQKLAAKKSSWTTASAKLQYKNQLKEYISNRLLAARASGQYRPLPRKGVTVGLHWLLPKPFGNDYRQEPWMVHASDNMVYIPKDKITDVSPEEVAAGDWRKKIVPSPVGNDMLYMQ